MPNGPRRLVIKSGALAGRTYLVIDEVDPDQE